MTEDSSQILSAFIDGEEVAPQDLLDALSSPSARETLRDFAMLRAVVRDDESRPGSAFYENMEGILQGEKPRRPWWRFAIPVPAPALAVASLACVALLLWFGVGPRPAGDEFPPEPDRVVRFEKGVDWHVQNGLGTTEQGG